LAESDSGSTQKFLGTSIEMSDDRLWCVQQQHIAATIHLAMSFDAEACQELETTTFKCQMGTLPLATAGERVVHEHFQPDMRLSAATWPCLQVTESGLIGVKILRLHKPTANV
jgi:hypothetical protein